MFFFTFKCIFFRKILHLKSWNRAQMYFFWKILKKKTIGIASKLKENCSEEGKNAKFSACGGLGSKKEFQNNWFSIFVQKNLHSPKSKKNTLIYGIPPNGPPLFFLRIFCQEHGWDSLGYSGILREIIKTLWCGFRRDSISMVLVRNSTDLKKLALSEEKSLP